MKNEHLIPPIVMDIVDKFNSPSVRENEKLNYMIRLEAIRDYCDKNIKKHLANQITKKPNTRVMP